MSQYKKRINLERNLIKTINFWFNERPIYGLSNTSINNWVLSNNLNSNSEGVMRLIKISKELLSLANRSQEVVDEKLVSDLDEIEEEIMKISRDNFKIFL